MPIPEDQMIPDLPWVTATIVPPKEGVYQVQKNPGDFPVLARWDGHFFTFFGKSDQWSYKGVSSYRGPMNVVGTIGPPELHKGCHSLSQIQSEIGEWSKRNFGDNESKRTGQLLFSGNSLLGIVEELGELAHVVLKGHQGIRGYDDPDKYAAERNDAMADILVYLCDYACREGVDLQSILSLTWDKVRQRDWQANKTNADQVVEAKARDGESDQFGHSGSH